MPEYGNQVARNDETGPLGQQEASQNLDAWWNERRFWRAIETPLRT